MTDRRPDRPQHPDEHQLIDLALGTLPQDDEAAVLPHLLRCPSCRARYDELSGTLDAVLAAGPAVAPPAGFEARVLDRLSDDEPAARAPRRRLPRMVAAAAAVALLLGGAAGVLLDRALTSPGPSPPPDDAWTALETADGAVVGSVAPSRYDGREVVVVRVTDGPSGKHYRCLIIGPDGSRHDAGEWTVPPSGEVLWIATLPEGGGERIELVTDDGRVWSAAPIGD